MTHTCELRPGFQVGHKQQKTPKWPGLAWLGLGWPVRARSGSGNRNRSQLPVGHFRANLATANEISRDALTARFTARWGLAWKCLGHRNAFSHNYRMSWNAKYQTATEIWIAEVKWRQCGLAASAFLWKPAWHPVSQASQAIWMAFHRWGCWPN